MVISDMMCNGIGVFLPLSEHQPYDLIAVRKDGKAIRVQVKYRGLGGNGSISIPFKSAYSDANGYHERPVDRSQFDCYAVYCPESRRVYYIRNNEISRACAKCLTSRVLSPRNNQRANISFAADFEGVSRIFE
jgi:PD-(D/E)XK endonuclease